MWASNSRGWLVPLTSPHHRPAVTRWYAHATSWHGRVAELIGCGVCPPHADVSTQGQYQMMDEGFVGLIVSCFVQDAAKRGQVLLPLVALHG